MLGCFAQMDKRSRVVRKSAVRVAPKSRTAAAALHAARWRGGGRAPRQQLKGRTRPGDIYRTRTVQSSAASLVLVRKTPQLLDTRPIYSTPLTLEYWSAVQLATR